MHPYGGDLRPHIQSLHHGVVLHREGNLLQPVEGMPGLVSHMPPPTGPGPMRSMAMTGPQSIMPAPMDAQQPPGFQYQGHIDNSTPPGSKRPFGPMISEAANKKPRSMAPIGPPAQAPHGPMVRVAPPVASRPQSKNLSNTALPGPGPRPVSGQSLQILSPIDRPALTPVTEQEVMRVRAIIVEAMHTIVLQCQGALPLPEVHGFLLSRVKELYVQRYKVDLDHRRFGVQKMREIIALMATDICCSVLTQQQSQVLLPIPNIDYSDTMALAAGSGLADSMEAIRRQWLNAESENFAPVNVMRNNQISAPALPLPPGFGGSAMKPPQEGTPRIDMRNTPDDSPEDRVRKMLIRFCRRALMGQRFLLYRRAVHVMQSRVTQPFGMRCRKDTIRNAMANAMQSATGLTTDGNSSETSFKSEEAGMGSLDVKTETKEENEPSDITEDPAGKSKAHGLSQADKTILSIATDFDGQFTITVSELRTAWIRDIEALGVPVAGILTSNVRLLQFLVELGSVVKGTEAEGIGPFRVQTPAGITLAHQEGLVATVKLEFEMDTPNVNNSNDQLQSGSEQAILHCIDQLQRQMGVTSQYDLEEAAGTCVMVPELGFLWDVAKINDTWSLLHSVLNDMVYATAGERNAYEASKNTTVPPYPINRLRDDHRRVFGVPLNIAMLGFSNLIEYVQWHVFQDRIITEHVDNKGEKGYMYALYNPLKDLRNLIERRMKELCMKEAAQIKSNALPPGFSPLLKPEDGYRLDAVKADFRQCYGYDFDNTRLGFQSFKQLVEQADDLVMIIGISTTHLMLPAPLFRLRILLSEKLSQGSMKIIDVEAAYQEMWGRPISLQTWGYPSLTAALQALGEVCIVQGIMVHPQKPGLDSGHFIKLRRACAARLTQPPPSSVRPMTTIAAIKAQQAAAAAAAAGKVHGGNGPDPDQGNARFPAPMHQGENRFQTTHMQGQNEGQLPPPPILPVQPSQQTRPMVRDPSIALGGSQYTNSSTVSTSRLPPHPSARNLGQSIELMHTGEAQSRNSQPGNAAMIGLAIIGLPRGNPIMDAMLAQMPSGLDPGTMAMLGDAISGKISLSQLPVGVQGLLQHIVNSAAQAQVASTEHLPNGPMVRAQTSTTSMQHGSQGYTPSMQDFSGPQAGMQQQSIMSGMPSILPMTNAQGPGHPGQQLQVPGLQQGTQMDKANSAGFGLPPGFTSNQQKQPGFIAPASTQQGVTGNAAGPAGSQPTQNVPTRHPYIVGGATPGQTQKQTSTPSISKPAQPAGNQQPPAQQGQQTKLGGQSALQTAGGTQQVQQGAARPSDGTGSGKPTSQQQPQPGPAKPVSNANAPPTSGIPGITQGSHQTLSQPAAARPHIPGISQPNQGQGQRQQQQHQQQNPARAAPGQQQKPVLAQPQMQQQTQQVQHMQGHTAPSTQQQQQQKPVYAQGQQPTYPQKQQPGYTQQQSQYAQQGPAAGTQANAGPAVPPQGPPAPTPDASAQAAAAAAAYYAQLAAQAAAQAAAGGIHVPGIPIAPTTTASTASPATSTAASNYPHGQNPTQYPPQHAAPAAHYAQPPANTQAAPYHGHYPTGHPQASANTPQHTPPMPQSTPPQQQQPYNATQPPSNQVATSGYQSYPGYGPTAAQGHAGATPQPVGVPVYATSMATPPPNYPAAYGGPPGATAAAYPGAAQYPQYAASYAGHHAQQPVAQPPQYGAAGTPAKPPATVTPSSNPAMSMSATQSTSATAPQAAAAAAYPSHTGQWDAATAAAYGYDPATYAQYQQQWAAYYASQGQSYDPAAYAQYMAAYQQQAAAAAGATTQPPQYAAGAQPGAWPTMPQ